MEQWEVIAVDTNFIMRFKDDGRELPCVRLLLKGDAPAGDPEDRFIGFNWQEQKISKDKLMKFGVYPCPGDVVRFTFNRFGDLSNIEVVK